MRALVTGGAGFVGSNLVDRLLAEGWSVDVVDDLSTGSLANLAEARADPSHDFTFHRLDVRSQQLLELMTRRRPEVVFHLAAAGGGAASIQRPVLDADVNVLGSLNVLEGARAAGAGKVVFAAAGFDMYGPVDPDDLPVKESHGFRPATPHGVAKRAVVDYLAAYRERHAVEFTALALGTVYGPRAAAGVVAAFAQRLVRGEPCPVAGDGSQTRDFVFVDDVVDAFARAADKGSGLLLNVATGTETSVAELHAVMCEVLGVEGAVVAGPAREDEPARVALDPGRAGIHLGWRPWTTVAEGVAATLDAFTS